MSLTVFSWTSFQINTHWSFSLTEAALLSTTGQIPQFIQSLPYWWIDSIPVVSTIFIFCLFNTCSAVINIHNEIYFILFEQ